MAKLLRLALLAAFLATLHYGWIDAGILWLADMTGVPVQGPLLGRVDMGLVLDRLLRQVRVLPDPWYSMAVLTAAAFGCVLLAGAGRLALRLAGRLRGAAV